VSFDLRRLRVSRHFVSGLAGDFLALPSHGADASLLIDAAPVVCSRSDFFFSLTIVCVLEVLLPTNHCRMSADFEFASRCPPPSPLERRFPLMSILGDCRSCKHDSGIPSTQPFECHLEESEKRPGQHGGVLRGFLCWFTLSMVRCVVCEWFPPCQTFVIARFTRNLSLPTPLNAYPHLLLAPVFFLRSPHPLPMGWHFGMCLRRLQLRPPSSVAPGFLNGRSGLVFELLLSFRRFFFESSDEILSA